MSSIKVGVLRGGPSSEYDVSLQTGAHILKHLGIKEGKYHAQDIFVDRNGTWHMHGIPKQPHDVISHFDVIVNGLHGHYGEDGKVQHILEQHGVPFTGSKSVQSAIGMNKGFAKKIFKENGIKTPYFILVAEPGPNTPHKSIEELASNIFKSFPLPAIVKPVSSGSSVGVTLARSMHELVHALRTVFTHSNTALVEEYIKGTEATVGVIDSFRGQDIYALPPIEIVPHHTHNKDGWIFDYENKYGYGGTKERAQERVPGNFTHDIKRELEEIAKKAHDVLGLRHYSRSDLMIHPKRGIYILETNSLPGLTPESLLPKALEAVGVDMSEFLDHIITLAINKHRRGGGQDL